MARNTESIGTAVRSSENQDADLNDLENAVKSIKKLLTWYAKSDIVQPGFKYEDYAWYGTEGNIRRNSLAESLLNDQKAFLQQMEEGFGDWMDRKEPIFRIGSSLMMDFTALQNQLKATSSSVTQSGVNKKMISFLKMYTYTIALFLTNMCHILEIKDEPEYQKFLIRFLGENVALTEELFDIKFEN